MSETTVEEQKKPGNAGKYVKRTLLVLLALVVLAAGTLAIMFQGELRTLGSIERMDDTSLFTMDYKGDYGFDEFLAKGGASTDTQLLDFLMKRLLKGLPISFDIPDLGCSTFQVASPDGDALFGRNFDMYYSPALFVRTAPKDGYKSISMVNLSYIGFGENKLPTNILNSLLTLAAPYVPLDGVNEKGLAVGVLLIDTAPTDQKSAKPDITTTTAIRMMLDQAATVDEALSLLERYDMHSSANSSYHFQIADATGKAVVVEYIGDALSIIDSPRATNFLLTPGDWDFGGGQDRFDILEKTMTEKNNVFTAQEAMDLLKSVAQTPKDDRNGGTQWSCVYNQTKGTVDISVQRDYDNIYTFGIEK